MIDNVTKIARTIVGDWEGKPAIVASVESGLRAALDASGWVSLEDWASQLVPWIVSEIPRANGKWHITHSIEVGADDKDELMPALTFRRDRRTVNAGAENTINRRRAAPTGGFCMPICRASAEIRPSGTNKAGTTYCVFSAPGARDDPWHGLKSQAIGNAPMPNSLTLEDRKLAQRYAEWLSLRYAFEAVADDEPFDEIASSREQSAFHALVDTPAQSVAGIYLKLNAACIVDHHPDNDAVDGCAILAAMRDAERLAGLR